MSPGEQDVEETIVQTSKYHITRRRGDDFHIITISGRYTDEMLEDLRSKVFLYKTNYAVIATGLAGVRPGVNRK